MTEPYSREEMREMSLNQCQTTAWYWSRVEDKTPREMCDGVVFSILNIVDGMSGDSLALSAYKWILIQLTKNTALKWKSNG